MHFGGQLLLSSAALLISRGVSCPPEKYALFVNVKQDNSSGRSYYIETTASTLEECQHMCTQNYQCRQITFNPSSSSTSCFLRVAEVDELGPTPPQPVGLNQFGQIQLQKVCVSEFVSQLCAAPNSLGTLYPHKVLVGHARTIVTVSFGSVDECIDQCAQAHRMYDFTCRSLMFYRTEADQNCILNSVSRQNMPGLFVEAKNEELVDYFETDCQAVQQRLSDNTITNPTEQLPSEATREEQRLHSLDRDARIQCVITPVTFAIVVGLLSALLLAVSASWVYTEIRKQKKTTPHVLRH